ncbi:hypothetical protein A2U01_0073055, partial [Trifolium medium]|nr:hypothetical protein [Trifolium medium]
MSLLLLEIRLSHYGMMCNTPT